MSALRKFAGEAPIQNRVLTRTLPTVPDFRYRLRLSARPDPRRVLVIVHGISRQASYMLRCFEATADAMNYSLITPEFNHRSYDDYQRLGREGRGCRADLAFNAMLADVAAHTGLGAQVHLFGFSGGAQFAHRYTYAYADRVCSLTVAAAGWYTAPTDRYAFPEGTGATRCLPNLDFAVDGLLSTPTLTLVGEHDTERDPAMRRSHRLDKRQGKHRLARAQWFHRRLQKLAAERGIDAVHVFRTLPNTRHDFAEAALQGGLANLIFNFCEETL